MPGIVLDTEITTVNKTGKKYMHGCRDKQVSTNAYKQISTIGISVNEKCYAEN